MPETSFMAWLLHEFPDLYGVQPLEVRMLGPAGEILRRPLTRTTWDHIWHQVHRRVKPGNAVTVVISCGGGEP